jgi:hypothetical protein
MTVGSGLALSTSWYFDDLLVEARGYRPLVSRDLLAWRSTSIPRPSASGRANLPDEKPAMFVASYNNQASLAPMFTKRHQLTAESVKRRLMEWKKSANASPRDGLAPKQPTCAESR